MASIQAVHKLLFYDNNQDITCSIIYNMICVILRKVYFDNFLRDVLLLEYFMYIIMYTNILLRYYALKYTTSMMYN
jgi:hypothetical protein